MRDRERGRLPARARPPTFDATVSARDTLPARTESVQTKPLTPEELELAKGASLERNKAVVAYIKTLQREQKDAAEYIKAAALGKAAAALEAVTEPIRCGKDGERRDRACGARALGRRRTSRHTVPPAHRPRSVAPSGHWRRHREEDQ